jgi:hypothetical protein
MIGLTGYGKKAAAGVGAPAAYITPLLRSEAMSDPTLFDGGAPVNLRRCSKCNEPKPAGEFYARTRECKGCYCARVRANRAARREQYSEYERRRLHTPEREQQRREAQRRRRSAHPEKNRARAMVGREVKAGRLIRQPCEVCGTNERVQAHHDDYSKPLEVRWMCFKCHRERAHGQVVVCDRKGAA